MDGKSRILINFTIHDKGSKKRPSFNAENNAPLRVLKRKMKFFPLESSKMMSN